MLLKGSGHLSKKETLAVQLVRDRMEFSDDRYAGQNEVLRTLNRYFYSLSPLRRSSENDIPTESEASEPDLFVPLFFTLVQQAVPTWIFQLFATQPYVRVFGRTREDHDRAHMIEKLTTYNFDQAEVMMEAIDVALSLVKYGTAVWKAGWRYDQYKLKETWKRDEDAGIDTTVGSSGTF